ncbi:hypothetical protein GCM10007094_13070 [Pseudovibrio japonicus]|uniref:Uncharacterized protein n=1 Tax=Pseudovibrio japonicus TaxID=366534 RepID=A0ABQ3E4M2_9HYPH|nr:hypothetical protein [Pseudovibrio japonicus]GHB26268.1 hypothetical protein GCM10007094_13070 [Pseudovibrio japonicus]
MLIDTNAITLKFLDELIFNTSEEVISAFFEVSSTGSYCCFKSGEIDFSIPCEEAIPVFFQEWANGWHCYSQQGWVTILKVAVPAHAGENSAHEAIDSFCTQAFASDPFSAGYHYASLISREPVDGKFGGFIFVNRKNDADPNGKQEDQIAFSELRLKLMLLTAMEAHEVM